MHTLITPYGNQLLNLMADTDHSVLLGMVKDMSIIKLDHLMQSDLVLLLTGAYSPISGYMNQADYKSVLDNMRLSDGRVWAIPLTLEIPIRLAQSLKLGQQVGLSTETNEVIALLTVSEIYRADATLEAKQLGATLSLKPEKKWYVAGSVVGISIPKRYDFADLWRTPAQLREYFQTHGWGHIVSYHSTQPLHCAAYEFISRTAAQNQAALLINPIVGGYASERFDYYALVRSYQAVMSRLSRFTSVLSLSHNYPRRGGAREILQRAILMRNYGCSHLIVGGDPTNEGQLRRGSDLQDTQVFQKLSQLIEEIGVGLIPYPRMVYVEERAQFLPLEEAPKNSYTITLNAAEAKRRLQMGLPLPDWYAFSEVLAEMRLAYPPRVRSGLTIVMTGLPGVGKSTLALALSQTLMTLGKHYISIIDKAMLEQHPLIVSDTGILSVIATEITRHAGIVICATANSQAAMRREMRHKVQAHGGYLEFYLTAPTSVRALRTAESNDVGNYEAPDQPDLTIDTSEVSVVQAIQIIVLKLEQEGYLR